MVLIPDLVHPSVRTPAPALTTPLQWPWATLTPPLSTSETTGWSGALLRRWSGTSPVMVQPPLDQHYVVMHLGGAKRVVRRGDAAPVSTIADCNSLTIVPAGTAFIWQTSGPIAFAHLYVDPDQLGSAFEREFDLEARGAALRERVAFRDPLLESLLIRAIVECEAGALASNLLLDSLLESFLVRLASAHAARVITRYSGSVALAPHRLQRVFDFIDANLHRDIGLADLVIAGGSSQFHFSHAFRLATGCSPYRYLIRRRIAQAKVLLMTTHESLATVSVRCGFGSPRQFAVMFRKSVGMGPKKFALAHRARSITCGGPKRSCASSGW